jgi:hypothetical protein
MTNDKQTPEEAAREYASGYGHGASISKKLLAAIRKELELERHVAFEAGYRLSQEREKVLWTGWAMINNDGTITQDSPILDTEPWKTGKYVRVNIVEVPE